MWHIIDINQLNPRVKLYSAGRRNYNRRLNNISDQALKEKDHATYNLLQWFVNEQVEEEASVGGIISKLKLVKEDGYGLLMIDNELGSRTAPAPLA